LELASASFNTDDCQACPRNSPIQTSLFNDALAGGKCADHECFGKKTQTALEIKKTELAETYHVVFLDTERDGSTYTEVSKSGAEGVGEEQYNQGCKGCANFGALLSSKAGLVGQVTNDLCFDLTCHKEKVASQKMVLNPPVKANKANAEKSAKAPQATITDIATKTDAPKKAPSNATPKRVIDKMNAFYQVTAEKAALNDVNASLSLAVYTMLQKVRHKPELLVDAIKTKWSTTISRTEGLALLYGCTVDELKLMLVKAASHLPNLESENFPNQDGLVATSKKILTLTNTDIGKHFTLDKDFLEAHTKGGIEIILKEAVNGFDVKFTTSYEAKNGEGSFSKLMKEKHAVLVSKVFEFDYDFTGYLPSCLSKNLLDTKSK